MDEPCEKTVSARVMKICLLCLKERGILEDQEGDNLSG